MIKGIYNAAQGMMYESMRIDVLANNLANVDSIGFKKSRMQVTSSFDAPFYNALRRYIETNPSENVHEVPELMLVRYDIDFTPGGLRETGNVLDVAIDGAGFFGVAHPSGDVVYTRDGAFNMDKDGFLVTAQHLKALDEAGNAIQLPTDTKQIEISPTGDVLADSVQVATLMVVDFETPYPLAKIGDSLFEINPLPRFGLPSEVQSALDIEMVSPELEQAFADNGVSLSPNALITTIEVGNAWRITDGNAPAYLIRHTGDGLSVYEDVSLTPQQLDFAQRDTRLIQGYLENSNVNIIHEMAQMIETMRNFEGYQRTILAFDETIQQLNEVARA